MNVAAQAGLAKRAGGQPRWLARLTTGRPGGGLHAPLPRGALRGGEGFTRAAAGGKVGY